MVLTRMRGALIWIAFVITVYSGCGCGVRSGVYTPPLPVPHDAAPEAAPRAVYDGCVAVDDACQPAEICDNGADDDCDQQVDEGCACTFGRVQHCFAGPPGRRFIGACEDGQQVCGMRGTWGECTGGIVPQTGLCNGLDTLCDGCSTQSDCEIACPQPGDPRITNGTPFEEYALHGGDFYDGVAQSYAWRIRGGVCDGLAPSLVSFELAHANERDAVFTPRLSGDYTVDLTVTTPTGEALSCSYIVHVRAPGVRIEMCYPESTVSDVDLFMHAPNDTTDWYPPRGSAYDITDRACSWANCEALVRGSHGRVDFGYEWSPLSACERGPRGIVWRAVGACANPRLDIDNNLEEGTGLPENINLDTPRDGDTFRVMVQNFTGTLAHPVVNVYCGGERLGTYGMAPDTLTGFEAPMGRGVGMMWRVVDVTTHVDPDGALTCDLAPLHPRKKPNAYLITNDDPRY